MIIVSVISRLDNLRPVCRRAPADIHRLAAMTRDQLTRPAAYIYDLPLLIVAAAIWPLDNICSVCSRSARYIQ